MSYEPDIMREHFGREVYLEIEESILREVLKRPTIERWRNLCAIMADGVSIATNEIDRDIAKRGWLCLGAMHLRTLPLWTGKRRHSPLHEYSIYEIDGVINAFKPLAKSFMYYLEQVYPGFDYGTGRWSRAGQEDKIENPLPFFLHSCFFNEEDLVCSCIDCLFTVQEDDSVKEGMVYRLTMDFFRELTMITDDSDAELWIPGEFAGNIEIGEIRQTVAEIDELKANHKWPPSAKSDCQGRENATLNGARDDARKVFVVHGHDGRLLEKVKAFLCKHSLRPIVLREQPNVGRTIIEKFEYYAHVNYAVILLTADDIGYCKTANMNKEKRGRQNVVLEMGYFMGKYGRDKMAVLCDDGIAKPGDVDGLVYISTKGDWENELLRELAAAGFPDEQLLASP